jgi:hypothetical protein
MAAAQPKFTVHTAIAPLDDAEITNRTNQAKTSGMMTSASYIIDQTMAKEILFKRNKRNRKLSPKVVAGYEDLMIGGEWNQRTASGIVFADDGFLNNGQHRLRAIANCGVASAVYVTFGEAVDAFKVHDHGKPRGIGDDIGIMYPEDKSYQASIAGIIRVMLACEQPNGRGKIKFSLTDVAARRKNTGNMAASRSAARRCPHKNLSLMGVAAAHYLILTRSAKATTEVSYGKKKVSKLAAFFDGLATGTGLEDDDPRYVLRESFLDHAKSVTKGGSGTLFSNIKHSQPIETMALLIMGWNDYAAGKAAPRSYKWAVTAAFPTVDNGPRPVATAKPVK